MALYQPGLRSWSAEPIRTRVLLTVYEISLSFFSFYFCFRKHFVSSLVSLPDVLACSHLQHVLCAEAQMARPSSAPCRWVEGVQYPIVLVANWRNEVTLLTLFSLLNPRPSCSGGWGFVQLERKLKKRSFGDLKTLKCVCVFELGGCLLPFYPNLIIIQK